MSTKLRILVPIKRVLDYAIKPRIKKDQSGIDLSTFPVQSILTLSRAQNVDEPILRISCGTIPASS
jgi:hypothetical protein